MAGQADSALDLSWAEETRVFPKDPAWYAQMMVASLRRRIAVGLEKLEEASAGDDLMAVVGISTMIDHLRSQLDQWERDLRRLHRARFAPVQASNVDRAAVAQPRRRLDRRLGCGRPRARALVRSSSRGGDSGDPDLDDEHRPSLHEGATV